MHALWLRHHINNPSNPARPVNPGIPAPENDAVFRGRVLLGTVGAYTLGMSALSALFGRGFMVGLAWGAVCGVGAAFAIGLCMSTGQTERDIDADEWDEG